jgi:uncharacterized lipoprotein YmbA
MTKACSFCLVAGLLALTAGCVSVGPTADTTRFYTLQGPLPARQDKQQGLRVGLRTVRVPGHLHSKRMAVRKGKNELVYSDAHRWAEDLDTMVQRSLKVNLLRGPSIQTVTSEPWRQRGEFDILVDVTILCFEGNAQGKVHLDADWVIRKPEGKQLKRGAVNTSGTWMPGDYGSLANTMGRLIRILAGDIAISVPKVLP